MITTDAMTSNRRAEDRWSGERPFSASAGSLAFLAGHLGAGLGWHGSIASGSEMSGERCQLVESCA